MALGFSEKSGDIDLDPVPPPRWPSAGWPSEKLELVEAITGLAAAALTPFRRGETVSTLHGPLSRSRGLFTLQVGKDLHVPPYGDGSADDYLDHSCAPNTELDETRWEFVARRDIARGELITFNYLTTEWELLQPFDCLCRESDCLGRISGYRFLTARQRNELDGRVASWLHDLASESARGSQSGLSGRLRR
jgi:SET domain